MVDEAKPQPVVRRYTKIPLKWQSMGLNSVYESEVGLPMIILGLDNYDIHPTRVDSVDKMVLTRSEVTGKLIVAGLFNAVVHDDEDRYRHPFNFIHCCWSGVKLNTSRWIN